MEIGLAAKNAQAYDPGGYNPPTITARLKSQKEILESQLQKVNDALSCLEGNPELQKAVDAISRVGNY